MAETEAVLTKRVIALLNGKIAQQQVRTGMAQRDATEAQFTADNAQADADALAIDVATREPAIASGTTDQFWRGDKSWQTLNAAAVADFVETAQDAIAALLVAGANISLSYNDGANTLTIAVTGLASTNISDFSEAVDDRVSSLIQNGTGITWSYNDGAGTLTPTITITQYTDENARDAIGTALLGTANQITVTVNDAGDTITVSLPTDVTLSGTLTTTRSIYTGNNAFGSTLTNTAVAFRNGVLGLFLAGVGSTNDVTIANSVGQTVMSVPTGTQRAEFANALKSLHATGGVGYGTGAGGTVTQATNKATGVTLNKTTGQITTTNAALAAAALVSFVVTNSAVAATDTINLNLQSGNATAGTYRYWVDKVSAGSFVIAIENRSAGSLSEALVFNFAILKGTTS